MDQAGFNTNWEGDLAELLSELSSIQGELLLVLAEKRQFMAAGDVDSMTAIQDREQQLCQRLEACHDRRRALLELAKSQGLPSDSIGKLAESLPNGPGQLGKQVKDAATRTRLLQHHSLTNWVLAQRTLLHLSQLIEIIATGGRLQPTYSKGESVFSRGALVDREA